jgi:hypothetical protein
VTNRLSGERRLQRLHLLAERDGWACHYCAVALTVEDATVDEKMPLGRGGRTSMGNQVLACLPCNQDKADMTASEYAAKRDGSVPRSYQAYRRELKLYQKAGVPWSPHQVGPPQRPPRDPVMQSLADAWPES